MPKNSSRKKAARRRASLSGERYTRALRAARASAATATSPEQTAPGRGLDATAWQRDLTIIHEVQQLLQVRGWVVPPEARGELDVAGWAAGTDVYFGYPAAFSAPSMAGDRLDDYLADVDDDLAEDQPRGPQCSFSWAVDAGPVIVVETAGNWRGCRHHRVAAHTVTMDQHITSRLGQLLDQVESRARDVDPARLLACTLEGPCGARARRRAEQRARFMAWSTSMAEAGRTLSREQMAELAAWEDEHLNRTGEPYGEPLGTSDWPGWIPLIGSPPWREPPVSEEPDPDLIPSRSPDNDSVPVDLLRPALERRDLSVGAIGLWMMLVSYYWSCEDDRTMTQLYDQQVEDAAEIDEMLAELVASGMVTISPLGAVAINLDHLGELAPIRGAGPSRT